MKNLKIKTLGVFLLIPIIAPFIYWGCEAIELAPLTHSETLVDLIGQVKDSRTELPITNAIIIIGDDTLRTDQDGKYHLINAPIGTHMVTAIKEGYILNTIEAMVEKNAARVSQLFLAPTGVNQVIDASGGELSDRFDGNIYSITIPAGALDDPTPVSVTPLIGIELPLPLGAGKVAVGTASFGPNEILLNQPAQINIEIGIKLAPNSQVPVEYFDPDTKEWIETDTFGIVGVDSSTVFTSINHLGIYAVVPPLTMSTETNSITTESIELSCVQARTCSNYKNSITLIDENFSDIFAINMVEQIANASFRHELEECINYSCPPENQIGMASFGMSTAYANHLICFRKETLCCTKTHYVLGIPFYSYEECQDEMIPYPCHSQ